MARLVLPLAAVGPVRPEQTSLHERRLNNLALIEGLAV
jgi:hypothetical protein